MFFLSGPRGFAFKNRYCSTIINITTYIERTCSSVIYVNSYRNTQPESCTTILTIEEMSKKSLTYYSAHSQNHLLK